MQCRLNQDDLIEYSELEEEEEHFLWVTEKGTPSQIFARYGALLSRKLNATFQGRTIMAPGCEKLSA